MVKVVLSLTLLLLFRSNFIPLLAQNVCPVDEVMEWEPGDERTGYFDNTLHPNHTESWRLTWMSQLDDQRHSNDVTIPGTHQSFSHFPPTWFKCNTWAVSDQLEAGLRFFDIRIRHVHDELLIYHGPISQHNCLDNVVEELVQFLEIHPTEFVLFRLVNYVHDAEGNTMTFTESVLNITNQYDQDYFWKESTFPPTVSDVRGKIVILHEWDDPDMWGLKYGENAVIEDDWFITSEERLQEKWEGNVQHLDEVPTADLDTMYIMYNSGNGYPDALYWTPTNVARDMNNLMFEHLPTLVKPSRRGIILLDYPGYDIIGDVILFNEDVVPF